MTITKYLAAVFHFLHFAYKRFEFKNYFWKEISNARSFEPHGVFDSWWVQRRRRRQSNSNYVFVQGPPRLWRCLAALDDDTIANADTLRYQDLDLFRYLGI